MAIANKLEVTLSFKPLMDGLNRFSAGINQRLQQVQAFNAQIRNGDAAMQKALGQVGAVLGAAALSRFAKEAREADKVQAQLIATLSRTKQTGAIDALNAQAAALQKLTLFGDEAINTVQRLLITYGLNAQQAMAMTESVLDFAQANNIAAESAAQFIGKALKGDSAELGRYNIQLDRTKDRVTAMADAMREFAQGQARAAVPDSAARGVEARFGEATKNLGRAANQVGVPFLLELIPLLEGITRGAQKFANAMQPLAPILGNIARVALAVLAPLALIKGAMKVAAMTANLLSSSFAMLAGKSFLQLNAQLAMMTQRFGPADGLLRAFTGSWAGLGRAVAVATMAISAFFLGFEAGRMVIAAIESAAMRRLEVEDAVGVRIAEQNRALNRQLDGIKSLADARETQAAIEARVAKDRARIDELEEKAEAGRKKRNEALMSSERGRAIGVGVLSPAENSELEKLRKNMALAEAQLRLINDQVFVEEQIQDNVNSAGAKNRPLSDEERAAAEQLRHRRALFELESQIREAEFDGNTVLQERLIAERDLLLHLEELGRDQYDLAINRINIEADEREKKRKDEAEKIAKEKNEQAVALADATAERDLARSLAAVEAELAAVQANRYLTTEEKQARILPLLEQENKLLDERIKKLDELIAKEPDPQRRLEYLRARDTATDSQQRVQTQTTDAQPRGIMDSLVEAAVAMQSRLGTIASQINTAFTNVGESIRTSLGGALADMVLKGASFKEAMLGFGQAIATSFINAGAQMVADWIMNHVIMDGVRSLFTALGITKKAVATTAETQIHAAGEAAKTTATVAGETARTGVIAAGAVVNTGIIVAEAATVTAATGVAGLMHSIMQLGPIAGPAVMVASIAGVMALIKGLTSGFSVGGSVEGPGNGTSDSILARLSNGEFVNRASSVSRFGRGFFNALNDGVLDLSLLPDNIAAGMAAPVHAAAAAAASGSAGFGGQSQAPRGSGSASTREAQDTYIIMVNSPEEQARAQRKYTDARVTHLYQKNRPRRSR